MFAECSELAEWKIPATQPWLVGIQGSVITGFGDLEKWGVRRGNWLANPAKLSAKGKYIHVYPLRLTSAF
jgi:hypothetical protein